MPLLRESSYEQEPGLHPWHGGEGGALQQGFRHAPGARGKLQGLEVSWSSGLGASEFQADLCGGLSGLPPSA